MAEHVGKLCRDMTNKAVGGYGALGAVVTTQEVAKAMEFESSYYSTYGWHPLSVAAAIANIKFLLNNKAEIFRNAASVSHYFAERLTTMAFKSKTKVRICSLAIGIEFNTSIFTIKILYLSKMYKLLALIDGKICLNYK